MSGLKDYGCRVYPHGLELHTDGRHRKRNGLGVVLFQPLFPTSGGPRRAIAGFTKESRKRLGWTLANATVPFAVHATLTYHARVNESDGEQDATHNRALAARSKIDLNRLLARVRDEIGACPGLRTSAVRAKLWSRLGARFHPLGKSHSESAHEDSPSPSWNIAHTGEPWRLDAGDSALDSALLRGPSPSPPAVSLEGFGVAGGRTHFEHHAGRPPHAA